ncbi:hypothetical protein ACRALDRAFT_2042323 [Sodiomyces alcalophilus JCM 7366]|uniref:uncharacterized protein n=1 Tax=Sodiomyces alcalophilus JCM 7366 TaxID=591952 RepID=UPI0039B51012
MSGTVVPDQAPDTSLESLVVENSRTAQSIFCTGGVPSSRRWRTDTLHKKSTNEDLQTDHRYVLEYANVRSLPESIAARLPPVGKIRTPVASQSTPSQGERQKPVMLLERPSTGSHKPGSSEFSEPLVRALGDSDTLSPAPTASSSRPLWHPPWKLMRVISGHLGWVRCLAMEPGNKWFASGSGDRTIKIWDLATGSLRLTLTGHISTVRGLAVSSRHPYLFSCGEDKMVKCWDLETNKVIRHYHGHLSGVYTLALHPTLDVLVTGGRDGVARVWDMRTRSNIHVLSGHTATVSDVKCQEVDPQVVSASLDSTVRLWDLAAGKTMTVLTHHKKGVRALAVHPNEFTFATGSTGSIKQWKCPEGAFMQNFEGHNAIINTLSVNQENVFFSGGKCKTVILASRLSSTKSGRTGDNGSMSFWDWKTGYRFQSLETTAQPGSLDAEAGIMSSTFDRSGLRLICGEADKTIKIWKPDEQATPDTHPLTWQPSITKRRF